MVEAGGATPAKVGLVLTVKGLVDDVLLSTLVTSNLVGTAVCVAGVDGEELPELGGVYVTTTGDETGPASFVML